MGSSVSAPIERQVKALRGRRYMRGMRPEKYFEVVVKKEQGELLDTLGFSDDEAFAIFVQFMAIDDDNSGEVSIREFHRHLNSQATKYSERVFTILDKDTSGLLDLREFIVGVWNYCTYDKRLLIKLVFEIFDVDRRGIITMAELDAMIRMLHGSTEADPDLLRLLAVNGSGDEDALTLDEFLKVVEENYQVLQPAFELQKAIRRKILGVKYWERMTRQRARLFASYDEGGMTNAQSLEAIITAKQKDLAEERERTKLEVEAKHDENLKRAVEENRKAHENQQLWKIQTLDALRNDRPVEEVEEEEAWKALREGQAVITTDYTEDTVEHLRAAREILWDCYEHAVAASKASAKVIEQREIDLALEDDANNKADRWIHTKQGGTKYDFLCRQAYGNLLHKDYARRGSPTKAFTALHAPGNSPVTLATNIAYNNPRPAMLVEAKAIARRKVVDRFAKQDMAEAKSRAERHAAQQEADFATLHDQLVAEAGARCTSWDLVKDLETGVEFYLHVETDGSVTRHPKDTAVCHKCDAAISPEDRICSECNTARSRKNMKLYKGF